MARILLLLSRSANRDIVAAKLAPHYQILSITREQDLLQPFDLLLVDGPALEQYWQAIQQSRTSQHPVLLPVLLIVAKDKVNLLPPRYWQGIEEILTAPIELAELQARVETLLRIRKLSQDLQQANTQLKTANEDLQELNRLKSQFVSMVSHEFRNPLGVISGYLQLIDHDTHRLSSEKQKEFFQRIRDAIKRLVSLVDDVLIMGRMGVGKLSFEPVPLDLIQFCGRLVEETQHSSRANGQLQLEIDQELAALQPMFLDQKLLTYILTNLLSNAVKYSPESGTVRLHLSVASTQVMMAVTDQGIGIPVEDQAQLFEPFQRATNVGRISGTGLGLAITKLCTELHGGQIEIDSVVDQGTTVTVLLPLEKEEES
ncbi:HAMP domain-containing sensor histidine kinase [Acaryochloris sp. IP29b_bin.148]|uniref:ATP-binding response regulator n=1 Tax=Acaryochloris sp. IP29b_bin.148 TaxID=2969218 RepID=UPI00262E531F|nr:HAMP domain-containing sensor histidine kinase [Acaryochloris sp. IP29b_bin.148]